MRDAALKPVGTMRWLYACWLARRASRSLLFSKRQKFWGELRPFAGKDRIAWPQAWLFIAAEDVKRAHGFALNSEIPITLPHQGQ